jgi:3-oxosteroid 1-dehydrogenase
MRSQFQTLVKCSSCILLVFSFERQAVIALQLDTALQPFAQKKNPSRKSFILIVIFIVYGPDRSINATDHHSPGTAFHLEESIVLNGPANMPSTSGYTLFYAQRLHAARLLQQARRSFADVKRAIPADRDARQDFDAETDVIIVGSGAAGLTAALRCHDQSLRTILVEKTAKIGGTSALSGGGMWIPNNPFIKEQGNDDSIVKTLTYMHHCIGEAGPAASHERRRAFVENAPRMLNFLTRLGFRARASGSYPNYHPDLPGGDIPRCIESVVFNARKLGSWYDRVRKLARPYPAVYTDEASRLFRAATSPSNLLYALRVLGGRDFGRKLLGQIPVTMGPALVCQLLHMNLQRNTQIWLDTPLTKLLIEDGAVVGAIFQREGRTMRVRATRGVILVAGGFARNVSMRQQHQENPITAEWTSAQEGDMGEAICLAQQVNAQVALMDDAWWGPTLVNPANGQRFFAIYERSLPHSIIVDSAGQRFMNEAQSYTEAGHETYKRHREVSSIPAWMILDHNHRRRYPLADMNPGRTPKSAIDSGFVHKADSIAELATKIGVDSNGLEQTVLRFNEMARRGKDEDFGRGGNVYDQFFADDLVKPNGSLGAIARAPFYAVKVWPGDLGTKGGLLTDEAARVISTFGLPIPGLYAAGNSTASVMGRSYPGPGSTLAPALTFSYIAVNHIAGRQVSQR